MKNGVYTVEPIELETVKLLYRPDEMIVGLIPLEQFPNGIKEGDLVEVKAAAEGLDIKYLEEETQAIRERVRALRDELLDRSKDQ